MPAQASVSATNDTFPVKLEAPAQGFRKTFRDAVDVHHFLSKEVEFWADLRLKAAGPTFDSGQHLLSAAGETAARGALGQSSPGMGAAGALIALTSLLTQGAILSLGKQGRLLAELSREAPTSVPFIAAGYALTLRPESIGGIPAQRTNSLELATAIAGQLLVRSPNSSERLQLDGLLAETTGLKSDLERERRDFVEWRDTQKRTLEELLASFDKDLSDEMEKARNHTSTLISSVEKILHQLRTTSETSFREFIASSTASTEDFKKKVRQDVVHEVPTTFWNDKAKEHRTVAICAGAAFLVVAAIGVGLLANQGVPLVSHALNEVKASESSSAVLALVPLAFITIPALAFAWVLRHISRMLVQNLSLGADARLRGTITSTFRALVADRTMSDAELAIALQALFRPMDGKDHAEIAPPNLVDLLKLDK